MPSPVDGACAPQGIGASDCHTVRVSDRSIDEELARVMAHGAPAQRREAQRLLAALQGHSEDAVTVEAARQLVDAYLHDPYLERGNP